MRIYPLLLLITTVFAAPKYVQNNELAPRLQWMHNGGYCGEVCLISAGLYYGQYLSQYDVRKIAANGGAQDAGEVLLGINDLEVAEKLHLKAIRWDAESETDTHDFISWVKGHVESGHPVAMGVFANQKLFYSDPNPTAGDEYYDHIVMVSGWASNKPLTDAGYDSHDLITFNDNGLWDNGEKPPYIFSYAMNSFQTTRKGANTSKNVYSLENGGSNFGLAVTGVNGDTLPVQIATSVNYENEVGEGNVPPPQPLQIELTLSLSSLTPNVAYKLYRYNTLNAVPDAGFNAKSGQAIKTWDVQITTGTTYTLTETISSDEMAFYRCVRADAP